ncbi:cation:proton antiporter [Nesterenkonia aerolata]|uniref:Monovalent cation/H(+) antiporter subunit G n=1 Tax=Nesterenkonia aerolata TaxID=3074079 RepID=A0ABU2DNL6_9MICC|nr:monovalent cation/H(+) antiporter subunit G [Nesterenkonia sp. LY-0111]MDR8018076.1 monovalent cation/H(+) antiporter subunit G [Nesterenkonia sp. LY-0111]
MTDVFLVLGLAAIFLGIFILLVSAIGLFRFPDLYLRASAVGTSAGLGVACIVVGALMMDFTWMNLLKAFIAVLAQMLASAVGSMAIARSGYQNNSLPADVTWIDDLRMTRRDLHE